MQALKRDFKIRKGRTVENYFFLEKSKIQIALVLSRLSENDFIFNVDIYRDGMNQNYRWELRQGFHSATFLHATVRESLRLFEKREKEIVWEKYQDQNFRVGVSE